VSDAHQPTFFSGVRDTLAHRPVPATEGRFGLVGMTERARALGGTLVAGPTEDRWAVVATLPLVAAAHHEGTGTGRDGQGR